MLQSSAFCGMGYACSKDSWDFKSKANFAGGSSQDIPSTPPPSNPLPHHFLDSKVLEDFMAKLSEMNGKFEYLQDLLHATLFKMDQMNELSKLQIRSRQPLRQWPLPFIIILTL